MFKKIISVIITGAILFGTLSSASACHFHPDPPKSIVIDGIKYVSGFYDAEHLSEKKSKVDDYDEPLFTKDDYDWYKILDT